MKLGHIELFVADPGKSLAFYRDVLGCEVGEIQGGGRCVWLKLGDVEILLREGKAIERSLTYSAGSVGFVLYTDDLDKLTTELKLRGLVFTGNDGSDKEPTFVDPDGHWFQIVNPRDFC